MLDQLTWKGHFCSLVADQIEMVIFIIFINLFSFNLITKVSEKSSQHRWWVRWLIKHKTQNLVMLQGCHWCIYSFIAIRNNAESCTVITDIHHAWNTVSWYTIHRLIILMAKWGSHGIETLLKFHFQITCTVVDNQTPQFLYFMNSLWKLFYFNRIIFEFKKKSWLHIFLVFVDEKVGLAKFLRPFSELCVPLFSF